MFETLFALYAIGFFVTVLVLIAMAARDPFLTTKERIVFPLIGGVTWPYTWYVWFSK